MKDTETIGEEQKTVEKRDFTRTWRWWENLETKTKLEHAFAIGCQDKEACIFAEITLDQLYYYTREVNPDFQLRKEELKEQPILRARQTIVDGLGTTDNAKWYLERKRKNEFAQRSEHTGAEGAALPTPIMVITQDVPENNGDQENTKTTEEN